MSKNDEGLPGYRVACPPPENMLTPKRSALGLSIAFGLWGLCLLAFPKYTGLFGWLMWTDYIIGLVLLFLGIFGACLSMFPGENEG